MKPAPHAAAAEPRDDRHHTTEENPFVALLATPAPENPFAALLAKPNPYAAALADARREADERAAATPRRTGIVCFCGSPTCTMGRIDGTGMWETDENGRRTGRRLA